MNGVRPAFVLLGWAGGGAAVAEGFGEVGDEFFYLVRIFGLEVFEFAGVLTFQGF